jgi:N-dimethylarginine dimethylaminohydrolase
VAELGGAVLDNEENYLIKKLLNTLGIVSIENQARMTQLLATLVGSVLLRGDVVQAGHTAASDREGQLEAMTPTPGAPGWGPSRRR